MGADTPVGKEILSCRAGQEPAAKSAGKNHKGLCGPVQNKNNKARMNGLLGAQGTMSNHDSK